MRVGFVGDHITDDVWIIHGMCAALLFGFDFYDPVKMPPVHNKLSEGTGPISVQKLTHSPPCCPKAGYEPMSILQRDLCCSPK